MARAWLVDRKVISLSGGDRVGFLQGLVSNDVTCADRTRLVWAALLTPQGRYLSDFFIWHEEDRLLLDVPAPHAETLCRRLARFRLRADIRIDMTDEIVEACWGETAQDDGRRDPRLDAAGTRRILPQDAVTEAEDGLSAYHAHRIALGLPSPDDCESEKTLLLEANFDWLNGISWKKGCYMGQELTARTHYRGLVKKRLVPLCADGPLPAPGTLLMDGSREIGMVRTSSGQRGLAFLRREYWDRSVACGDIILTPDLPDWFHHEASGDGSGDPAP
ncbi:glycine cleavage system protein T [Swaminathania salitolerans LMG 21291]|uniref:Glycine cleavage system protein T n=2 Tax=Swaminathania salitolerans TaxID=182838 RepID=A0A511BYM6_9PROT|nr:glycine cleavage system protein T [Swaminathania salitolerans LMG 21291]GEL03118.1 glycine cleavage system protein T [Swaminathania salitolerans]